MLLVSCNFIIITGGAASHAAISKIQFMKGHYIVWNRYIYFTELKIIKNHFYIFHLLTASNQSINNHTKEAIPKNKRSLNKHSQFISSHINKIYIVP